MRKFGEYAFLKDSRYARQAKSARAFPLSASARSGVIRMRIGLAAVAARPGDQRKGYFTPPPRAEPVSPALEWPRVRARPGAITRIPPCAACRAEIPALSVLRCVGRPSRACAPDDGPGPLPRPP